MAIRRDYIPQGETPTPVEQAAIDKAAANFRGGVKQNFIPPVGWAKPFVKPRAEQIQEALAAADKRAVKAKFAQYDDAVRRLALLDDAMAVEDMQRLPEGVRTLWLVAESNNRNRPLIMDSFGKIGDEDRRQFDPYYTEGKTEDAVPAKVATPKASVKRSPAHTATPKGTEDASTRETQD